MDETKWERIMMQGHPDWFSRPKLEIPSIEPTTPRRQGTSTQSPRGIYDFPISPQSPGEGILMNSPMKPSPMKTIPKYLWVPQDNYIDLVPTCAQFSPRTNHPGHGFGDCNVECSSNSNKNLEHRTYFLPSLNYGDNVLVRCNQSKWLVGQVKRASGTSVKVWIGAADTLVNIPVELFPTHLARMDCATPCSSPNECHNPQFYQTQQHIKTRVQCVRPAHLSHRHLFQFVSSNNPMTNSPQQQMHQAQYSNSTSTTSRMKYERHCFAPKFVPNPLNLSEHIAYLEREGIIPPKCSILKQSGNLLEPLITMRKESNPHDTPFDTHGEFVDLQAQSNRKLHLVQRNQQGNRPSYPRPSTLPMLNVNLNNEGPTPRLDLPFLQHGGNSSHSHHVGRTSPYGSPNQLSNMNPIYEDSLKSPLLYKPHYEQFVAPQMLTKGTMTATTTTTPTTPSLGQDMKSSPKKPPTSPQLPTKGIMELGDDVKSPKPPPMNTPSHIIKGKEICEDRACPSWAEGTDFRPTSLERSVSLDSFQPPSFPSLVVDPQSLGARPPRDAAASSAEPVWVTVIDNGHGTRKLKTPT